MSNECWVGLDVSKARLDVYRSAGEVVGAFDNDDDGIAQLLKDLKSAKPTLVVLEATA